MSKNSRRKRDDALALALASGQTLRGAAHEAGIDERTVQRRMADASFRRRVEELRAEMIARALGRMADGMTAAADRLRQLLSAESENVQLGACRALLELTLRLRENVELEARVAELEKQQKERTTW